MKINTLTYCILSLISLLGASKMDAQVRNGHQAHPEDNRMEWRVTIRQYDYEHYNRVTSATTVGLSQDHDAIVEIGGARWRIMLQRKPAKGNTADNQYQDVVMKAYLEKGYCNAANLTLELADYQWSRQNYVLMPGAAYNGNRFEWRRIAYSPKLLDPKDIGPNKPAIISDVPRLDVGNGPSRLIDRVGGLSVPMIAYHSPARNSNHYLLTYQGNHLGDYGLEVEENRDRSQAILGISSPIVRELYKYRITDSRFPSDDKPANFKEGDTLSIRARLVLQKAKGLQSLFDQYLDLRTALYPQDQVATSLPYSAAFKVMERKYNKVNWVENPGYYAIGKRENFLMDWQIGWTGGMILTLPLLYAGGDSTIQRVIRNLDWVCTKGISPSGYFYDSGEKGTVWYGGDVRKPTSKNWHLARKGGDGLFYVIKHLQELERRKIPVKPAWKQATKGVANAFVTTFRKWGQWGQFIDSQTGDVAVGGSASAAIVPAALVLASQYYQDTTYLNIAKAGAAWLYNNCTAVGLTTGGPGDALQNPDSESAYALVESYLALYEVTGNPEYLKWAEEAATQFSTWVCAYNYRFPPNSLFGKTGILSKGAVLANTQNKHGAPGICTFSGQALLKLSLATGKRQYAELLYEIAHGMPQYLGHPNKPIDKVQDGFMCERVSMTDWLEGIGEITYQTTWAEASLGLSYTELPGVLLNTRTGNLIAFDNVLATVKPKGKRWELSLANPTKSVMELRVLATDPKLNTGKLTYFDHAPYQLITLKPGERKQLTY